MKTIIAGSRHITGAEAETYVADALEASGWLSDLSEVVSGGAPGIDDAGERWSVCLWRPLKRFPADWQRHGRAAGPIRNREMAEYADRLLAVWDGQSRGTKNMIETMRALGKPVYVYFVARAK